MALLKCCQCESIKGGDSASKLQFNIIQESIRDGYYYSGGYYYYYYYYSRGDYYYYSRADDVVERRGAAGWQIFIRRNLHLHQRWKIPQQFHQGR